jgi:dTDP-4-dehydrorhamnose reductase
MVMAPLPLSFVVAAIAATVRHQPAGVLQASGPVDITYADVALHIARRVGADSRLVRPQDSSDTGLPAIFAPRNTTLDTSRLQDELGLVAPDVWSTIDSSLLPRPTASGFEHRGSAHE